MLRWARKVRLAGRGKGDYAVHSDFCAVFLQQLDRLYSLALILTGDELRAEECFLAAFDSCVDGRLVFKELAASWSKRSVIKAGIKLMLPVPSDPSKPHFQGNDGNLDSGQEASLKYVLELSAFDRFVFVMSVLEGCSDRDCALLLGCSCVDLVAARIRAFQQISRRVTEMYSGYGRGAQPYVADADWLECG
jgi:hypothetical protein